MTHLELDEMEDVWVRKHNDIASCLRSRENVNLNKGGGGGKILDM